MTIYWETNCTDCGANKFIIRKVGDQSEHVYTCAHCGKMTYELVFT